MSLIFLRVLSGEALLLKFPGKDKGQTLIIALRDYVPI